MVLRKFKKIANSDEVNITCIGLITDSVIKEGESEYHLSSDVEFKKKYKNYLFVPAILKINRVEYEIN